MSAKILRGCENARFSFTGCDFVVQLSADRKDDGIRLLQLTDMQVIDASQRRTPDRLRADEIEAWAPQSFAPQCGNHIRSLITQTHPDLIFITGDIVYGSFDDKGTTLDWLCSFMDSFEIPWAPVFGNHDNESKMGVAWQCERLESSRYCLFKRGSVSGNGNYTVGIAIENELVRVLHMLDSNGCSSGSDPDVIRERGLYPDQLELIESNTALVRKAQGRAVPAFLALHIPIDGFKQAEIAKGYRKEKDDQYVIGVSVPAADNDFGFCLEPYGTIPTDDRFHDFLRAQNVDGVFAGHVHNNCFSISHRDITWTFGLKTGQYDYHVPYQLGGTLVTLRGAAFDVKHIPSLVPCAPMPAGSSIFKGLLATGE